MKDLSALLFALAALVGQIANLIVSIRNHAATHKAIRDVKTALTGEKE